MINIFVILFLALNLVNIGNVRSLFDEISTELSKYGDHGWPLNVTMADDKK